MRRLGDGAIQARVEQIGLAQLPPGDVLIQVAYSSLNYKDALAAQGHPGIARKLPHVPGVDAAGTVVESQADHIAVGQQVLVTGCSLGEDRFGGWSQYVRMPSESVVPLPEGLSLFESMALGTAGFTAAQCVLAIQQREIDPQRGPVLVTGATGGVGSFAVALLAKAGYEVVALTGKQEQADYLRTLGAAQVVDRSALDDGSDRPLLTARWSAAVDTVGGRPLVNILRSTQHRGVVAACGLVAGAELPLTVYPFILRGVSLIGIDSAQCPMAPRLEIWKRLASDWKLDYLDTIARVITFDDLPASVEQILAGKIVGRVVVQPQAAVVPAASPSGDAS
ncbi:MAG: oxidoreductase [Planctomycetales bacterium]|nr:oxidoreductase [Planctomycetales bacterium]